MLVNIIGKHIINLIIVIKIEISKNIFSSVFYQIFVKKHGYDVRVVEAANSIYRRPRKMHNYFSCNFW